MGIIHRDVSPHNVLISKDGQVKLTDFGIACAVERLTVTCPGMLKGKPGYLSPEQAEGCSALDPRSDIFSLGIVIYEMLTGKNPFLGKDLKDCLRRVLDGEVPKPSALNPACGTQIDAIVLRALARHPEHRYASTEMMFDDLDSLRVVLGDTTGAKGLAQIVAEQRESPPRTLDHAFAHLLGEDQIAALGPPDQAGPLEISGIGPVRALSGTAVTVATPSPAARVVNRTRPRRQVLPVVALALLVGAACAGVWAVVATSTGRDSHEGPADAASLSGRNLPADLVQSSSDVASTAPDARSTLVIVGSEIVIPVKPGGVKHATKRAAGRGALWINLVPWARVTVDGVVLGDTPFRGTLTAGRHRVVLENPDVGLRREFVVTIVAEQVQKVKEW